MQLMRKLGMESDYAYSVRMAEWAEKNERWSAHTKYTPDIARLSAHNWNIFLITDDMMRGRRAHQLLKDRDKCMYLCTAYTINDFTMFKKNLGLATYPVVLDPPEDAARGIISRASRGPIRGELWAIKADQVKELDKHRLNTVEFHRRRVYVDIPYQTVNKYKYEVVLSEWMHHEGQRAWMYIGDFGYWHYNHMHFVKSSDTDGRATYVGRTDPTFSAVRIFEPREPAEVVTLKFKEADHQLALGAMDKLAASDTQSSLFWSNAIDMWIVRYHKMLKADFKPYFYYTTQEDVKLKDR